MEKKSQNRGDTCLEFAKLNSRENFSFLHLLWLGSTNIERKPVCLPVCQPIHSNFSLKKYEDERFAKFAKLNSREKCFIEIREIKFPRKMDFSRLAKLNSREKFLP